MRKAPSPSCILVLLGTLAGVGGFPGQLVAADRCLTGPSASTGATGFGDAAEIAAVRAAVTSACNCTAFAKHRDYVSCARGEIRSQRAANRLRRQCVALVKRIFAKSICGYAPTAHGNPVACVKKRTTSGNVACSIRPSGRCTSTARASRTACLDYQFCLDAADTTADLQLTAADSGACGACGNNVLDAGEECDGTASTACPGHCRPDCQCAVCGNGVTEAPVEQCDGLSGACPGFCSGSCTCPNVVGETVDIPSSAQPPNTPGTAGVTVTNSKLITQFGGTSFSLNNARYTRFHWDVPSLTPQAILILVPGFEGGANDFKILAENLLPRALADHGLLLEVWGVDRRTNQLEDTLGLDIAESLNNAAVGLDWLFGAELGLTLDPALATGPNRRAVFYNPQDDVPFLANWTNLVFSQDIDAVVAAADTAVTNHNVFLGGHSAGTGYAARYAATDFNLSGAGPADPGYAKLRGLVLLEGGGGSTGGTPLTSDTLDRIEAKFDGGLFGAVRDNAPRCVDGVTACTVGTEDTDCAALPNHKCTPPTTAYAVVPGLLNARILASVEPVAIQGVSDPDGGPIILQVDQGTPGNNAVAVVPDLSGLSALPKGTVEGGLGSFVDDDGFIAGAAPFVATSVGAPGPVVGGLQTWRDITEGPVPASAVPNNGPPPTSLPATRWGQEKEVTRFDRLLTTFFAGGSNFTDWYFPNAGPSTTTVTGMCTAGTCTVGNVGASCTSNAQCSQSINLDSSALSIGRARRDIENLTQAANIDIPVIGFGGSNGLAPVPGVYVPFAQSIGLCTASSCDGSPRVVDATTPNPAFPTFGNVNGGFEVYISEGFAHVDVLTAEDTADNNVLSPLAAFLARNTQP
jgi:pimeloyl-ACP methyl ester carboxylesterase